MLPTPGTTERRNNLRLSEVQGRLSRLKVSVLPDFFLDRIISVPSLSRLFKQAESKAAAGGGSLRGYTQKEIRGGNAANLAFGLASLSVRTILFCVGDELARAAISNAPSNLQVRLIPGRPGLTAALEFPFGARMVNVMISDAGDIADFDGRKLKREDVSSLERSDCVALVHWSANKKGNLLARKVFASNRRKDRLTFLDPADLDGAGDRIKPLKKIIDDGLIDVISVNENETRILARFFSTRKLPYHYKPMDVLRASASLHDTLQATVDIHTPICSASASSDGHACAQTQRLIGGVVTGAGDIWDAGDILGHLMHTNIDDRLNLANASAHTYVASGGARLPKLTEIQRILARSPEKP